MPHWPPSTHNASVLHKCPRLSSKDLIAIRHQQGCIWEHFGTIETRFSTETFGPAQSLFLKSSKGLVNERIPQFVNVMSRWGSLVIVLLRDRSYRFSELAYLIGGVSEKMLAQTLRRLEIDGFVHREVHATKPPKVEYSLSPLGCELGEHVHALLSLCTRRPPECSRTAKTHKKHEAGSSVA
jgi:DNA-binding HxlR family transcriptional regulator